MINFSEEYKYFVWMPPKTATTRAIDIFSKFGFVTKKVDQHGKLFNLNDKRPKFVHNHEMFLFEGSENYKLICTGRNPYSRMVSYFKMNRPKEAMENIKENYSYYLTKFFYFENDQMPKGVNMTNFQENWNIRKPDYYIRVEKMYEDYLNIPFVKSTEIYQNGLLEKMCEIKKNENKINKKNWREYYTDETADMVFYNFSKYFENLGYDKNSYKF